MELRIASLIDDSIVDGSGLRYAIYVQGCPHRCPGCHNPQTHDFAGGQVMDTAEIWTEIRENPLLSGITFSGGEPFSQPKPLLELAKKAHDEGLSVWAYSGWTFEELLSQGDENRKALLRETDVLVDGAFQQDQRSLELSFRGSKNQRLIDVQTSLKEGIAIEKKL